MAVGRVRWFLFEEVEVQWSFTLPMAMLFSRMFELIFCRDQVWLVKDGGARKANLSRAAKSVSASVLVCGVVDSEQKTRSAVAAKLTRGPL